MKDIKKRIEELEKEIKDHQQKLAQYQQVMGQLQTAIISKQGGLQELKKLEVKDSKVG